MLPSTDPAAMGPVSRTPGAREIRVRRIVSMVLSCLAIVGSSAVLYLDVADERFLSFEGTLHMDPFRAFIWNSMWYWIIPAVISLTLLSSLPPPKRLGERLCKPFGVIAVASSALCIALPAALTTVYFGSFFIGW